MTENDFGTGTDLLPVLPPPPPAVSGGGLALRPVWVGLIFVGAGAIFGFAGAWSVRQDPTSFAGNMAIVASSVSFFSAYFYYFMCCHRMVKVLGRQVGWNVAYTPAGVVWRNFIPFYGIYFLFEWMGDVQRYIGWRAGTNTLIGRWSAIGVLVGFLLTNLQPILGIGVVLGALLMLSNRLQTALQLSAPADGLAPMYSGTLNLR